jgi:hypothetical protein
LLKFVIICFRTLFLADPIGNLILSNIHLKLIDVSFELLLLDVRKMELSISISTGILNGSFHSVVTHIFSFIIFLIYLYLSVWL